MNTNLSLRRGSPLHIAEETFITGESTGGGDATGNIQELDIVELDLIVLSPPLEKTTI